MGLLLLIKASGFIFGPLMLLTGAVALVTCAQAAWRPGKGATRRALAWALMPLAVGVAGAAYGAVRWELSDDAGDRALVWALLGCTVLFGALVTAMPLAWSAVLAIQQPAVAG